MKGHADNNGPRRRTDQSPSHSSGPTLASAKGTQEATLSLYPNEGGDGECPPEWDVNLFILRVGGRGVCGDVAVQGLFRGPASVFLFVCLFVCLLVRTGFGGWAGSEFRGKDRTKRFRRARSTKSEREVGSDSLILGP